MKGPSLYVAALLMLVSTAQATAGPVHVPRDSPIVMHGRLQPSGPQAVSTAAPGRAPGQPLKTSCRAQVFPDPRYRPMWVPDTTCWTGFETIRVPGHWQGP